MPTGIAFRDGALYVIAVDKLIKYENAEANLDKLGDGKVVYDDMPSYAAHGWNISPSTRMARFLPAVRPALQHRDSADQRLADSARRSENRQCRSGGARRSATASAVTSIRAAANTGSPENARDWMSDDIPSDKLNMVSKLGEHFGYPYCHQGNLPDPKFAMGHKCSEFTPPVLNLGAHVAPLGMKFYTGSQFPAEYKNSILIAEHGSWNRHKYQGARIVRVTVGPDGKNPKQDVFASGWLEGDQGYLGRPADIILDKDGSILVADDWAGAIYRISYKK